MLSQSDYAADGKNAAHPGKFVIHLCSIANPISIPQPRSPQLVRYSFFLHTCWEEGGKRHRLYMGYFQAREDAERWLVTLRRIYPSAFVTEVPQNGILTGPQLVSLLDQGPSIRPASPARAPATPPRAAEPMRTPAPTLPRAAEPAHAPAAIRTAAPAGTPASARASTPSHEKRHRVTLEDTLEALKLSAPVVIEDDELSSTGVRHLKIEIQKDAPRSKPAKRPQSRNR